METVSSVIKNDSCCPSLSLKTRVICFLVCLGFAIFFGILAAGALLSFITGNVTSFVIFYSLCTVCSVGCSFFLKGPSAQWKVMTNKKRIIPTIIFCVAFVSTFICAFAIKDSTLRNILCIICLIIQILASALYVLSFIPFGKEFCAKCCKSCFTCDDDEKSESII